MTPSEPDRVMLITGSRKGIGRALAEHYLARGDFVAGCSRSESDLNHERYRHFTADVRDADAVRLLIEAVRDAFGKLDILINNAGVASMNHILTTPANSARRIMETNFLGSLYCMQHAARLLRSSKAGRIVNLVSIASPLRLEGEAVYAAAKSAVEMLTRIASYELAPFNITVNAVGPTPIDTDLIAGVPPAKLSQLIARQALKRKGSVDDVRNVIDFFLRPESGFVTGQVIYLGGVG
jgi:3-oxoacyl-[acyl-carrier protein] reductase